MSASNRAARIGPIDGIWRNNCVALCFLLSASNSRRACWCKSSSASLLVVKLRPTAHAGLGDFLQPVGAMTRCVNLLTGTGDGPASVESFQANHHAREIFGHPHIPPRYFLPPPYPGFFLLHHPTNICP